MGGLCFVQNFINFLNNYFLRAKALTNFNNCCKIFTTKIFNEEGCTIIKHNVRSYQKPEIEIIRTEIIDVISTSIVDDNDVPKGPWFSID